MKTKDLGNFGTDLTPVARQGQLKNVLKRKRTSRNDGNFSSTSKKQSCLVGDAGVGKLQSLNYLLQKNCQQSSSF
jgi:ATP-dependent Clp protease ATP-binding subunit ClpA